MNGDGDEWRWKYCDNFIIFIYNILLNYYTHILNYIYLFIYLYLYIYIDNNGYKQCKHK